ncbi:LysR family transcriptional regulator [Pseudomonas sp. CFBP 8758]|uniref:LysR family transcriptional regulator n=1 Tax=Pseudomonas sp. CFBP 8758 TaxID=2775286 RepID=UPI0017841F30|nr:LysR family transcriptional regulator [Pseudomonas sp. CFBP 8758]MBD8591799.1 LysR family transcriptional regulator [Pseudomonas sp. CFBP 8758]
MDISQLRMLTAIYKAGSIVKAAKSVHCVPSNVTARMKALEAEVGCCLLNRGDKGVELSAAGKHLLMHAEKVLQAFGEAQSCFNDSKTFGGTLKIGGIDSFVSTRLAGIAAAFERDYPQVILEIVTDTWPELVEHVLDGKLDVAVVAMDTVNPRLVSRRLPGDRPVLVYPQTWLQHGPLNLNNRKVLAWPEGCPFHAVAQAWCEESLQGVEWVVCGSWGGILTCVAQGIGMAVVPRGVYCNHRALEGLAVCDALEFDSVDNFLLTHKRTDGHPVREGFVQMLCASVHSN